MVKIKSGFFQLIEHKDWKTVKSRLNGTDPFHLAEIIEELSAPNDVLFFRCLSKEQAKEAFQFLSHDKQEELIEGLANNTEAISNLLNDLDPDDRTAFFEELPGDIARRLIQLLSDSERATAIKLLGFPPDSVGRIMTPEYVQVKMQLTVEQALDHIRKFGRDSETLNVIYVVDDQRKLIDDIRIKEIILASPQLLISDLTDGRFIALNVHDDQEKAIKVFRDTDRTALPVIDSEGIMLGIVTVDDIMDVAEEETTDDFHKFGSIQSAVFNPLKAQIPQLYLKRIGWLMVLVLINVFSGQAIAEFESLIQSVVALVFFLPLLIDSGGNAGSQSATLMIRALALGTVKSSDLWRLLSKELLVALLLGLSMAAGVAVVAGLRSPEIMWIVPIAMVIIVVKSSLIGLVLPFAFQKLKLDPATASAPLITSIADIGGVLVYFSIAQHVLR